MALHRRVDAQARYDSAGLSEPLDALQALFNKAITHPTGIADFLAEADDATRERFAASLAQTPEFDRIARMTVYADAYFWRLHDVLTDHFDHVAWMLGPVRFRNLATDYVLHCPSEDPDIRRFGARLPAFLATHPASERCCGLSEIAAAEWAMVRALDLPQDVAMTEADLAAEPIDAWPTMVLVPVASAWIGRVPSDFDASWQARVAGAAPPDRAKVAIDADVLVWRSDVDAFAVVHRMLAPDEAAAWRAIAAGEPFAALCELTEDPATAVQWLRGWISSGSIARGDRARVR